MAKVGNIVGVVLLAGTLAGVGVATLKLDKNRKQIQQIDSLRYENAIKRINKELINRTINLEEYNYNLNKEYLFGEKEYKAFMDSLARLNDDNKVL